VLQDWYQTVIRPKIRQKSLLLLDAYGGFNDAAGSGALENEHGSGDSQSEDENSAGANDLKFGFIVPAHINQKNIVSFCLIFCRGGAYYHQAYTKTHHRSSAAAGRLLLSAVQGVGESGQRFDPVAK